jgi:hypothetical protein
MALFRATVKQTQVTNGVRIEKGMSVDFPSQHGSPMSTNGGKDVIDAFERKYGIDIKKGNFTSSSYILVEKIG